MGNKKEYRAYIEHLNVVQDLVVEGKVVAGNDVGAGILLQLPVGSAKGLAGLDQRLLRGLSAPVGLGGFLELTVCYKLMSVRIIIFFPFERTSHAGKPKNRSRWEGQLVKTA